MNLTTGKRTDVGRQGALWRVARHSLDRRRLRVVSLSWRASPVDTAVLFLSAVAAGVAPSVVRVGAAATVVYIPDLVGDGEFSGRLFAAIVAVGGGLFLSALAFVLRDAFARVLAVRLTYHLQRQLMAAVGGPTGISHVSSPAVEAELAAARGSLGSYWPAEAPGQIARVISMRLDGLLALAAFAFVNWWLALATLAFWLAVKRAMKVVVLEAVTSIGGEAARVVRARYLEQLLSTHGPAREIRVFGLRDWLRDRFAAEWTLAMKDTWAMLGKLRLRALLYGAAAMAVLALAYWWTLSAAYDGDVSLYLALVVVLSLPVTGSLGLLGESGVLLEFTLATFPKLDPEALARAAPEAGGVKIHPSEVDEIRFDNVSFSYGDKSVLQGLDLVLKTGETAAIVGLNGAGKTTLIALLLRLLEPTEGRILVGDTDLRDLDPEVWREGLSAVFQTHTKLPFDVTSNVAPGHHDPNVSAVRSAVDLAGLSKTVTQLPDQFETPLSSRLEGGTDLSGGQWQRIAIARLFYERLSGASLLALDEPTAALDAAGELDVYSAILQQSLGATMILTSHRFSTVRMVDTIHVLEEGRIVEHGSHDELMAADGRYATMFRMQASAYEDQGS